MSAIYQNSRKISERSIYPEDIFIDPVV